MLSNIEQLNIPYISKMLEKTAAAKYFFSNIFSFLKPDFINIKINILSFLFRQCSYKDISVDSKRNVISRFQLTEALASCSYHRGLAMTINLACRVAAALVRKVCAGWWACNLPNIYRVTPN